MDVTSKTDICNLALDLLSAGTVTNVDDPSDATEELLARHYDLCRRKLLRQHPWNFATKRKVLSPDSDTPPFGYAKQYSLPADSLRVLYVGATDDTIVPPTAYQVEGGKILMSDDFTSTANALNLIYIYDIKSVSSFDPLFITLLSYEIAMSISYKVSDSNTNVQRVEQLRKDISSLARAIDGQERPPIRVERSRALRARRAGSTYDNTRYSF